MPSIFRYQLTGSETSLHPVENAGIARRLRLPGEVKEFNRHPHRAPPVRPAGGSHERRHGGDRRGRAPGAYVGFTGEGIPAGADGAAGAAGTGTGGLRAKEGRVIALVLVAILLAVVFVPPAPRGWR